MSKGLYVFILQADILLTVVRIQELQVLKNVKLKVKTTTCLVK